MIYLDNAATTFPKPEGMAMAVDLCIRNYCGNPGRSGHRLAIKSAAEIYETRKKIAALIGTYNPNRIIFFHNTTMALNQAIKGMLLPGQHVVSTVMEHNSVLRPLWMMKYQDIDFDLAEADSDGVVKAEDITALINERTKLVVMAHALNTTGRLLPVGEIGKEIRKINEIRREKHGKNAQEIVFLVDAAQSAGSVPIDVEKMGIDMLAAPGHKALFGPQGTGFLYVRENLNLMPLIEGGTGTRSKELELPCDYPESFEAGTLNTPGIAGLGYGVDFLLKLGVDSVEQYEKSLVRPFEEALRNMEKITVYGPAENKTPVVLFNVDGLDGQVAADMLSSEYDIAVRAGFHCAPLAHRALGTYEIGAVRISLSPFNTREQMNKALKAIYEISKSV